MDLINSKYKSFEDYLRTIIKKTQPTKYWNLEWQEHKSRYVYTKNKNNTLKNNIIIDGQNIDILGHIYGYQVAIEVKESYLKNAYLSSKLNREQKEFLINFELGNMCKSFVFLYFHLSQNLYIVKWPSPIKRINFDMGNDKNVWLYHWNHLTLFDLCSQIGEILFST